MFLKKKQLIIWGILLVLAVPVLYGIYSWNRRTPLQVKFISHQMEKVGYAPYELELEIINPSLVPVYVWEAIVLHPDPLRWDMSAQFRTGVPTPYNRSDRPSGGDYPACIPARGTVRVFFGGDSEFGELLLKEGHAKMVVTSCTTTKQRVIDWLDWAVASFPGIVNSLSDWAQLQFQREHLTFEVSGPMPTVEVKD